jgi:hypothetical protein
MIFATLYNHNLPDRAGKISSTTLYQIKAMLPHFSATTPTKEQTRYRAIHQGEEEFERGTSKHWGCQTRSIFMCLAGALIIIGIVLLTFLSTWSSSPKQLSFIPPTRENHPSTKDQDPNSRTVQTKKVMFEASETFVAPPSPESNAAWDSLMPGKNTPSNS